MKSDKQLDKEAFSVVSFFLLLTAVAWGLIIASTWASAETAINFQWTANTDDVTTGYMILMDAGDNVIVDVPGKESTTASYVLADDESVHLFSIIAYNDDGAWSKQGAMKPFIPKETADPGAPKQYLLTLEPVN